MKQFNLAEYLANPSQKVVTRDGRKVTRFLCTDAKTEFPIIALVEATPGSKNECLRTFTKKGQYFMDENSPCDLFFALEKHEGWINVYKRGKDGCYCARSVFDSKEKALEAADNYDYISTIKIEWEE